MTEYVTDVCSKCGNLKSVCSDPARAWYPQRAYCYVTAGASQLWRETEKAYKHPDPTDGSAHVTDGLDWWMSVHDLTPEDDFFGTALVGGLGEQPAADNG